MKAQRQQVAAVGAAGCEALLSVRDLVVEFGSPGGLWGGRGRSVKAVSGVSFDVATGETLGIVGESGCGKTTLARAILRLIEPTSGEVFLGGCDVTRSSCGALRELRRDMQIVFQDPFGSLNPRMRVGEIVGEPLFVQRIGSRGERNAKVKALLDRVGLASGSWDKFPHEFSGGQRQRIGIARALAPQPKLLVLDEPVSALDVSIQAQILNLLADLRDDLGLTYVFIAHDLAVVRHFCQRVAVMYLGKFVEVGSAGEVFARPKHPFTQALVSANPVLDRRRRGEGSCESHYLALSGEPPSPIDPPAGCAFHPRCPVATQECRVARPTLSPCGEGGSSRFVACYHPA